MKAKSRLCLPIIYVASFVRENSREMDFPFFKNKTGDLVGECGWQSGRGEMKRPPEPWTWNKTRESRKPKSWLESGFEEIFKVMLK